VLLSPPLVYGSRRRPTEAPLTPSARTASTTCSSRSTLASWFRQHVQDRGRASKASDRTPTLDRSVVQMNRGGGTLVLASYAAIGVRGTVSSLLDDQGGTLAGPPLL